MFVGGLSSVVGFVGDLFGADWSIPKIPRVSIPRLAQGAVIPPNREFMAVLGDNKKEPEIVSPVSTMEKTFENVLSRLLATQSNDNRPIIINVDGREIARATRDGENRLGKQTVFGGFANAY